MKILVINGPNLQLLGHRDPEVYGRTTLDDVGKRLKKVAAELGVQIFFFQNNTEGFLVDRIAEAKKEGIDGIVINPAAYTHTSIAIRDAIEGVKIPSVEIHISNIHARDEFRHKSMTAAVCIGQISGFGTDGYEWALRALVQYLQNAKRVKIK